MKDYFICKINNERCSSSVSSELVRNCWALPPIKTVKNNRNHVQNLHTDLTEPSESIKPETLLQGNC
jgi:hypothetical protein